MEELYNQMHTNNCHVQLDNGTDLNDTFPDTPGPGGALLPLPNYNESDIRFIPFWVISCISLPGICFALYKMAHDRVIPVYVVNLFISDLIQICANPIQITLWQELGESGTHIPWQIYLYALHVNVLFMMCISAERYLMIVHVFLYRKINSQMASVIISVIVWLLSVLLWMLSFYSYVMAVVLLLPYPLVMFFSVATCRALSRSSVTYNDQIRIKAILGLVLSIYTILFLPLIIVLVDPAFEEGKNNPLYLIAEIPVAFNPVFDLLLYVFMRRDVKDDLRAFIFSFKNGAERNSVSV